MAMESSKIQIRNCLVINCSWASALPWNESVRAVGSDKFTLLAQCTELHFKPLALRKCLRLHNHLISVSQNCGIPCSIHTVCLCKHTDMQKQCLCKSCYEWNWLIFKWEIQVGLQRIVITLLFCFTVQFFWDGSPKKEKAPPKKHTQWKSNQRGYLLCTSLTLIVWTKTFSIILKMYVLERKRNKEKQRVIQVWSNMRGEAILIFVWSELSL